MKRTRTGQVYLRLFPEIHVPPTLVAGTKKEGLGLKVLERGGRRPALGQRVSGRRWERFRRRVEEQWGAVRRRG